MPGGLSDTADELVRDYLTNNLQPANIGGYDPDQSPTEGNYPSNFLPITTDWSNEANHYPIIVCQPESSTVLGGGDTGYTSVQGDGSGVNQDTQENVLVSVQTLEGSSYLSDRDAKETGRLIKNGVHALIQSNAASPPEGYVFSVEPFGLTPDPGEEASNTDTWYQYQSTVTITYTNTPA